MSPITPARGVKDLLPDQSTAWQWLLDTHAEVARAHGYRLADSPIFEPTELFSRGVGEGTDVVDKEMYTFDDRGGRSLTLRPEGTAGLLRAVLGAHLEEQGRPVRIHYRGPFFRYDKPQAGRFRQFSQVGVECVGEHSAHLDAEVVEMAVRFLDRLGLRGTSVQLNSLGDADDRSRYRDALLVYYTPLAGELCEDCQRRLRINPLRLLDCKADARFVAGAPRTLDMLDAASAAHFADVRADLDAAGVETSVNERLVRGLDYYTDTVFEIWHPSLQGAQNALGGGGRYDGLAEQLGFASTPAVGYALGVERLLTLAGELGTAPAAAPVAAATVVNVDVEQAATAAALARRLRDAGISCVLDASARRLSNKLRDAGKRTRLCLIIGPDEERAGTVTLKDLTTGHQESVPMSDVVVRARATRDSDPAAAPADHATAP